MKPILFLLFFSLFTIPSAMTQDEPREHLPYFEIKEAPEEFNAGAMLSRMVDGLGFRFYWATDSLTAEDLAYRPTPEARTTEETIEHIYNLSLMILSVPSEEAFARPNDPAPLGYAEWRKRSLENFAKASALFRAATQEQIATFKIRFAGSDNEVPFWNIINGPIADAIYHTGQIVTLRRITGNPIHPGVSVFRGKTRT